MAIYHTCPICGSNLDPGESCDCKREPEQHPTAEKEGGAEHYGRRAERGGRKIPRREDTRATMASRTYAVKA